MLTEAQLMKQFSTSIFYQGLRFYKDDCVYDLEANKDPYMNLIEVTGEVQDGMHEYTVDVLVNEEKGVVFDADCSCEREGRCAHVVAVLLSYIYHRKEYSYLSDSITSTQMQTLLSRMDGNPVDILQMHSIILYPILSLERSGQIYCEFRIGQREKKSYVMKDITTLVEDLKNHNLHRYGKDLEFVHELSAFDEKYVPLVTFLKSIVNREDGYSEDYSSYYYYSSYSTVRRSLILKGRYLDEFLALCKDIPLQVKNTYGHPVPLHLEYRFPDLHSTLKKEGEGYSLQFDSFHYFPGNHKLYVQLPGEPYTLYCFERTSEKLATLLEFLSISDTRQYIANADLPSFARNVYPTLVKASHLENKDAFDPYAYLPDKPSFHIYLDLPQEDTITCRLEAVYKDGTYNVWDSSNREGKRDLNEERIMDAYVSQWFNSFDPLHNQMVILNDEEKMYNFVREGIAQLQSKATVFVSDKLKTLTIRSTPTVSIGVSVTKDNLLRLDMVADSMSQDEIAEILSRYSSRKKFYRLKSGEFVDMESNPEFEEFMHIAKDLQLSSSDIKKGETELPSYRAFYLDSFRDSDFQFQYEGSFDQKIDRIQSISTVSYSMPADVNATLRPYQMEGYRWLCALYENGFGALLADEMGLGKTIQVLTFLQAYHKEGKALVVCPASLVYNWYSEAKRFTPSLRVTQIIGTQKERQDRINEEDMDLFITSYDLLKRDVEFYKGKKFYVQIVDEAQYIKNANTQASAAVKSIDSTFHIALTGTPIENKLSELWSIFDFILPGYFYTYGYFRTTYEIPIIKEEDEEVQKHLQTMIAPFVLRRLKKDVLKDLPDKLEEVYYAEPTPQQKELYQARVQRMKASLAATSEKDFKQEKIKILAELTRLRQLCCNPALIYDGYKEGSGKEDMCIDLIKRAVEGGHKILVFSQFTSMLDLLTQRLKEEKIDYYLLVGSTPKTKRAQLVEQFQKDDVPVFCISLKAGGTGLNLTAADIVIHYDPWWNTAVENQASDRAHRIGQKNTVTIYRLILKDTIEERILSLQQEKSGLASRFLDNEGVSSSSLSKEDLMKLLD